MSNDDSTTRIISDAELSNKRYSSVIEMIDDMFKDDYPELVHDLREAIYKNRAIEQLEAACKLYCRWYDTGKPEMDPLDMSYELVSHIRRALSYLNGEDPEK